MVKTLPENLQASYFEVPQAGAITLQHAQKDDVVITFKSLFEGASKFAALFMQAGIQPGEVVVLIFEHGQDLVYSFWGAVIHGSIPSVMPFLTEKLSPERYRKDLQALVEIAQPAAIATEPGFVKEVRNALRKETSVRAVITSAKGEPDSSAEINLHSLNDRPESDIVLLQHSSGTTGLQKGVALSHRAIFNQLDAYSKAILLNRKDVIVSWLPLYHDMGLIAGFLMPVLARVPLVLMSPFDWVRAPYRLLQSVSQYRGTLTWMPNFAYNFCAQKIRARHLKGVDLSSWRAIINCSEPVKIESHRAFLDAFEPYGMNMGALQTSYAMAENVFGVTQSSLNSLPMVDTVDRFSFINRQVLSEPMQGMPTIEILSSGRPLANTRIRILDEKGNSLPEHVIGEISLNSNCMLTGYFNRPDITENAFNDGWFATGDYGYIYKGQLFVTGRKKDLLIVGGKNIYPQDLEGLVYEVEGVHPGRAVAFSVYDETSGTEEVVIVAESNEPSYESRQMLAERIRQHVTKNSAIALRHAYIVGPMWIIKTSSGKVARLANKDKYLAKAVKKSAD